MGEKDLLISVIVPIYNIEIYLRDCIDSILAQTYHYLDIILVDDGSSDGSSSICDEYKKKDSRIRVVHKNNGGLVSARKAGIKQCIGDYICHVDGDDFLAPCYIERFVKIINQHSPDVICSGEIQFSHEKIHYRPMTEREGYYDDKQIYEEIYPSILERNDGYYFNHASIQKCVKRELSIKCQLSVSDSISMSEDHAYVASVITKAKSLYISHDCLYYYRSNPFSITGARKVLPWSYPENMALHFRRNIDLKIIDFNDQYNRVITHMLFNTVVSQFNNKRDFLSVCKDISFHLGKYDAILVNTDFKSIKNQLMLISLKYRLYPVFKLYSLIKPFLKS